MTTAGATGPERRRIPSAVFRRRSQVAPIAVACGNYPFARWAPHEAVEGALAGPTARIDGTVVSDAVREGVAVGGVTNRVRVPTDLRLPVGVHDLDRADGMHGDLGIDVEVGGGPTDDEVARVREYPKRSPVYDPITGGQSSESEVTVRAV